jgi:hypothetical protein
MLDFIFKVYSDYGLLSAILLSWSIFTVLGTLILYIGYGFVMGAVKAKRDKTSQRVVVIVDTIIATPFVWLDIMLNIFSYSVICLDFRPRKVLATITSRMSQYTREDNERMWRKNIACFFAAFLDGKDPNSNFDHIEGTNKRFTWLD